MAAWLDRWMQKAARPAAGTTLQARLSGYPAFPWPHPGPAANLSLPQAQDNLQHLLAQRPQRLQALAQLLAGWDIDFSRELAGHAPADLLRALSRWALAEWPALRGPRPPALDSWRSTQRSGPDIVYAMLSDLAILLGEIIVRRRAAIRWAIDDNPVNGHDGMESWHRPVLCVDRSAQGLPPFVLDIELMVVERYRRIDDPLDRRIDPLVLHVSDVLAGAHERA